MRITGPIDGRSGMPGSASARKTMGWVVAAFAAVALAACSSTPVPTPLARASPAATPAPSPASTSPATPSVSADVWVGADLEVLFTGDAGSFAVDVTPRAALAKATVDFGDGSATMSVTGSCREPSNLPLQHVYRDPGQYAPRVVSAQLCASAAGTLRFPTDTRVLVLPAASAASAAWPTCSTYQLDMSAVGTGAGLGHVGVLVRLRNVSSRGCTLSGYPGIQLLSSADTELPTDVHHATPATGGDYLFPAITAHRVSLAPGQYAAFDLGYLDNPFGATANEPYPFACPLAQRMRIVLPEIHEYGTTSAAMTPCNGWVDVSAIFPGRDWIGFQ